MGNWLLSLKSRIWSWCQEKKDFFSYDYWNSCEKIKECLPSVDKFYDSLTDQAIGDKDYKHL